MQFPLIGDPGTEKILMFSGLPAAPAEELPADSKLLTEAHSAVAAAWAAVVPTERFLPERELMWLAEPAPSAADTT
jgi:hypothetical protein